MKVNFNNRDPVYLQVVRHFKEQIAIGRFKADEEIPSRRELANMLKINPNTVQKAYKEMEDQGLIYTEGNSPSRITKNERILKSIRDELLLEAVHTLVQSVKKINVPIDELLQFVKEAYEMEQAKEDNRED